MKFQKGHIPWNKEVKGFMKGENSPNWKGGIYKRTDGYIYILKPNHPHASKRDGYVLQSRLVMEKMLGHYLKPEEIVHHKNDKRDDDRPENLKLFPANSEHTRFHSKIRNPKGSLWGRNAK